MDHLIVPISRGNTYSLTTYAYVEPKEKQNLVKPISSLLIGGAITGLVINTQNGPISSDNTKPKHNSIIPIIGINAISVFPLIKSIFKPKTPKASINIAFYNKKGEFVFRQTQKINKHIREDWQNLSLKGRAFEDGFIKISLQNRGKKPIWFDDLNLKISNTVDSSASDSNESSPIIHTKSIFSSKVDTTGSDRPVTAECPGGGSGGDGEGDGAGDYSTHEESDGDYYETGIDNGNGNSSPDNVPNQYDNEGVSDPIKFPSSLTNPRDGEAMTDQNGVTIVYHADLGGWVLPEVAIKPEDSQGVSAGQTIPWLYAAGEEALGVTLTAAGWLIVIATALQGDQSHDAGYYLSKGGDRNIWSDQYGYPPKVANVDWDKSDSQLADDIFQEYGDGNRGPGSPNNMLKKWFRDKRPKGPRN